MSDTKSVIAIMCGGRGRRMGPRTAELPKPLVSLHGKPILELKLEQYLEQGFQDYLLCVGYQAQKIREAMGRFSQRARLTFSDSGEQAGILHRLWRAREAFADDVLMTYGDTFTDLDLHRLVSAHRGSDNEATIVVSAIRSPFGLVDVADGQVASFREKPFLNYYIGLAMLNRTAFAAVPADVLEAPDGEGLVQLFQVLAAQGKLGAFHHDGLEITFNTQAELSEAHEKLLSFWTAREDEP